MAIEERFYRSLEVIKISELIFQNLSIRYDTKSVSRSVVTKCKIVEIISVITLIILLFGSITLEMILIDVEKYFIPMLFVGFVTEAMILIGGVGVLTSILKKIVPRHYEFITWLMKFKSNEIEVGWLNSRFIIEMWCDSHGWVRKEIGYFIDEDYVLTDESDKSKPIHMTVDLTKEEVEIVITNA